MAKKNLSRARTPAATGHSLEEAQSPRLGMRSQLPTLASISEAMGTDKSPKEILRLILQAANSITRASSASLMLLVPGTDVLRVEVAEGFKDKSIYKTRLRVGQGVTGWVAETGVPLRLGNVTKDERYIRVQKGLRSELAVPMKIGGHIIGVISVDSTRLNHFTPEDEELLIALAAHSSRVIQSTQLHEETRRRAAELELLIEAGRVLAGTLDLKEVLGKLVELTATYWQAPMASVYLVGTDDRTLTLAAVHGGTAAFREQPPFEPEGSLLGKVLSGPDEVVAFESLSGSAHLALFPEDVGALFAAPLAVQKKRLGVLCVYGAHGRTFTSDEKRLLAGLARQASLAIENAHAYRGMQGAEEALRNAEKSNLLVEMASGLAHEIRNPLTSIKILVDSLARIPTGAVEAANDLAVVRKQIERLEQIVASYLESARAHASRMEHKLLDLNTVVEEALLLLATSGHEGLRMDCALHAQELRVDGDATQLSQAVYNLVLNAIQAVGQQPRASGNGRGRIDVRSGTRDHSREVFLEVADDGPGLTERVKERLFQPFVTTKEQGVGLGLSIVKRIVEAHHGRLEVESPRKDQGKGARFVIALPAAQG